MIKFKNIILNVIINKSKNILQLLKKLVNTKKSSI